MNIVENIEELKDATTKASLAGRESPGELRVRLATVDLLGDVLMRVASISVSLEKIAVSLERTAGSLGRL